MNGRLLLALFAALAACFGGTTLVAAGGRAADPPRELVGVTWELTALQASGQPAEDTTGAGLTILFGADGRVSGSGGCNQFTGTYTADAVGALTPSPLAATARACTQAGVMEREARYFATLREVTGFALDGATGLRLTFAQPGRQLAYRRGAAGGGSAQVTGTAIYLPRILPPGDATVIVQLLDTSRQDVPATVLAEQRLPTNGGGPPYAFALAYDPAGIVATGTYAVQARLEAGGRQLFRSTRAYLVITQNRPTSGIEVVMDPLGAPALPPTGGGGMAGPALPGGGGLLLGLGALLLAAARPWRSWRGRGA